MVEVQANAVDISSAVGFSVFGQLFYSKLSVATTQKERKSYTRRRVLEREEEHDCQGEGCCFAGVGGGCSV
jgi:hypothetical protein